MEEIEQHRYRHNIMSGAGGGCVWAGDSHWLSQGRQSWVALGFVSDPYGPETRQPAGPGKMNKRCE